MGTLQSHLRGRADPILLAIERSCRAMNQAIRLAEKAAEFILEDVVGRGRDMEYLLQDFIGDVTEVDSGDSFWRGLLSFVKSGKRKTRCRSRLLRHFLGLEEADRFVIDEEFAPFINSILTQENGARLAVNCRGAIIGKMSILIAALLEENVPEDSIRDILDMPPATRPEGIPAPPNSRETPDVVWKFYLLNKLKSKPFSVIPQSKVSDSYIRWTEAGILNLLSDSDLYSMTGIHRQRRDEPIADREVWLVNYRQDMMEKDPGSFLMNLIPNLSRRCCTIKEKMALTDDDPERKKHRYILRFFNYS